MGVQLAVVEGAQRQVITGTQPERGSGDLLTRMSRESDQSILPNQAPDVCDLSVVLPDVHAVGGTGDGQLRLVVHDEEGVVGIAEPAEDPARLDYVAVARRLLAQLDDVDAALKRRPQDLLELAATRAHVTDEI